MSTTISFDQNNLKLFTEQFRVAREHGKDSFMFEGQEFSTAYAKYLIEYLVERMKHHG